ncbi:MAG: hypothetical protein R2861_12925 [Desulfobacterales bacterium]
MTFRSSPGRTAPAVVLGDLAELKEGFADVDSYAGFRAKPAVIINVFRVADQNALEVAAAAKQYVADIEPGSRGHQRAGLQ